MYSTYIEKQHLQFEIGFALRRNTKELQEPNAAVTITDATAPVTAASEFNK